MVTAVGGDGWTDVEGTGGVGVPGKACEWGFVYIAQLTSGEDGVCSEVKGEVCEAVIGGDGWVGVPRLEVVECELHEGEEGIPQVERGGDVEGSYGGDDVIFRSAYVSFSKVSTVVVRGYVLDYTWGSACAEECADFGGGFIV